MWQYVYQMRYYPGYLVIVYDSIGRPNLHRGLLPRREDRSPARADRSSREHLGTVDVGRTPYPFHK